MRPFVFSLVLLCSMAFHAKAQTNTVAGKITGVKPFFGDEHALTVGKATLVLITDRKDTSGKSFEVNDEYKDLLVESKHAFILNPKYAHKSFVISYYVNGKGWKCIKTIKPSGK